MEPIPAESLWTFLVWLGLAYCVGMAVGLGAALYLLPARKDDER